MQQTTAQHAAAVERADRRAPAWAHALTTRGEQIGYGVLWVALAVFLWSRISAVDQFYLDEWTYTQGSQYIWEHLPGSLVQGIPGWDRGPQRLYSTLMAPFWGPLGASTAFTLVHLLNVLLLTSAIVPAALFARRVIDAPALRVLGVALGVAVPWLAIGAHQLAENLAFPLYTWAAYAIVLAAEAPTLRRQLFALALIGATTLCRLNFASIFAVLVAAVLAAEIRDRLEHREMPFGAWLRLALRRQWLIVAIAGIALVAVIAFLTAATSALGRYGAVDGDRVASRLWGDEAWGTRRLMLTFTRSLVVGTFVLPFTLGLAVALAGTAGRLGRRITIPAVVALSGLVATIVAVSVYTITNFPEERYVFVVCAPIGVLAAASLEHLDAARRWIAGAGAVTVWILFTGVPYLAVNSAHFFAAPAGATWSRVVDHRVRSVETDLFGRLFIPATGWFLLAVALALLVLWIGVARPRPRLRNGVVAAALGLCLAAQVAMLGFALEQELYGTKDAPGGIALSDDRASDRQEWIDAALPDSGGAAVLPGSTAISPLGYTEALSFWSKDLDATVAMPWNGSPVPAPPGFGVVQTVVGPNDLAAWQGAPPEWLVTQTDDPRVQFAGTVEGRSPSGQFQAVKLTGAPTAAWTASGIGSHGGVATAQPTTLTLDRAQLPDVRSVELTFTAAADAVGPARWRVVRDGRAISRGTVKAGATRTVRLPVPACDGACTPASWQVHASGTGALLIGAARLGT
jgi:hypothetical protein